jgi:hypothetical protein
MHKFESGRTLYANKWKWQAFWRVRFKIGTLERIMRHCRQNENSLLGNQETKSQQKGFLDSWLPYGAVSGCGWPR